METKYSAKLKSSIHFLKRTNFGLGNFLVSTQGQLDTLPPIKQNPSYTFIPMDMARPKDIEIWLRVFNNAFERNCTDSTFDKYILNHPTIKVSDTFFLFDNQGEIIGATSIGVFRKNPRIGVSHYIAICKQYQGKKLGYYIVLNQYHQLAKMGIKKYESETILERKKPIFLHFKLRFQPKYNLDQWNTSNLATKIFKPHINKKLKEYYKDWQLRTNTST